jgi:signal transduction histidine kinase
LRLRIAAAAQLILLSAAAVYLTHSDAALLSAIAAATLVTVVLAVGGTDAALHSSPAITEPELAGPGELAAGIAASEIRVSPVPLQTCAEPRALMARVSHELRTPLNAVLGFSDLMSRELFGPLGDRRYQEYACHIHDSGRALLKSAEDTLAVTALLTDGKLRADAEPLELRLLGAEAWHFFASERQRGICLDIEISDDIEVLGERRVLRQVLINLLTEALTRISSGGRLAIEARVFGDRVALAVLVEGPQEIAETGDSLAVCLARTMLELQGKQLSLHHGPAAWSGATVLDRAMQTDFFDRTHAGWQQNV